MLEGSDDQQKNLMGKPVENTGGLLAAENNYQPYEEEPADDNNTAEEETSPDYPEEAEEKQNMAAAEQAQLAAQQQAEVAISMAGNKQRKLQQIQKEINKLEKQLSDLEKDLTDFKKSKLGGLLSIFRPRVNLLIDTLIEQLKKRGTNLSDEAKVGYLTGLIITATSLIALLTALKILTSFLDAAFIHTASCLRLVIMTLYTIVIPIILILLSPLYITFLALIFFINKIPLLKGVLTKVIVDLIENLKKQRTAWRAELVKVKKKVALRKQIKNLKAQKQQVGRQK